MQTKEKQKVGISLIVLVITIIVVIILASAIILALNNNNPITNAKKATFQNDVKSYTSELELYKSKQFVDSLGTFNPDALNKVPYTTGLIPGTVIEILPSIKTEHQNKFKIQNGKLIYVGSITQEIDWLKEIGIDVELIIIDEETGKIMGVKDFAYIYGTLEIPDYVTGIAPNAFYKNIGIESIDFSKNSKITEIPNSAFMECYNLKSIIFSNNITRIGSSAFMYCYKLNNVSIPNSVEEIGQYAFYECSLLSNIQLPINEKYKTISIGLLEGINAQKIDIPENITTIQGGAFVRNSHLENITIPKNVSSCASDTFYNCPKLTNIGVDGSNQNFTSYDGVLYSKNYESLYTCPPGKTSVTIHTNTKKILSNSFATCSKISSINIPALVNSITSPNFSSCSSLTELTVDAKNVNFKSDNNVLYSKDMTNLISAINTLTSFTIPSTVKSIEANAFSGCSKLVSIDMSKCIVEEIKYRVFYCSNLVDIKLPSTLRHIRHQGFFQTKIKEIDIPEGTIDIDLLAFYSNHKIQKVKIPSTVSAMNQGFANCTKLSEFVIDSSNPYYTSKDGAVYSKDMTELVCLPNGNKGKFVIPNSVKKLKGGCLSYTYGLSEIILPNKLETIEGSVFQYATELASINIPSSVTSMGVVFNSCGALKEIKIQKPDGSLSGAPWGAPYGINSVKWNQ